MPVSLKIEVKCIAAIPQRIRDGLDDLVFVVLPDFAHNALLSRRRGGHPNKSDHGECAEDKISRLRAVASRICTADKVLAVVERSPGCPSLNFSIGVLDDA